MAGRVGWGWHGGGGGGGGSAEEVAGGGMKGREAKEPRGKHRDNDEVNEAGRGTQRIYRM